MRWSAIFLVCFLYTLGLQAQDYVDLFRFGYGKTFSNNYEGTNSSTSVGNLELDLTYPIPISERNILITGLSFTSNSLELFPNSETTNLYSTLLKFGIATTFTDKWSSTVVLLPKLASDYEVIQADDLYIGGYGILKYRKKENLIYRFGAYGSTEAFGFFCTPIIGWYYLSPNEKFQMDMSLPISADINYKLGIISVGMDYFGIGRSFNIRKPDSGDIYVDFSSLEFALYGQMGMLKESLLFKAKVGYASNDFEVYEQGDKIDLGLSAFSFGDNRTQLNPNIQGSAFLKFEVLYRFHIPKK